MNRKFRVADLFCGAGGSSTGAIRALLALGYTLDEIVLYCLNHWQVAIDTHSRNHPEAIHYCQDVATARPHQIVPEGYLDLLLASPTCTHHSVARGGKPTSDQQRSDPWHIIPWFTELRVKRAMIENVWEYTGWGPVDHVTGKPIKDLKGEYFEAWKDTIWRLGATDIQYLKRNSANYGTAQTRQRFIMKIRFDKVAIGWAPITHARRSEADRRGLKPWRPAREIIRWDIKGRSIFGRPVPLAPKTLARILAGAQKFAWPERLCVRISRELDRSLRHHLARSFGLRNAEKAKIRKLARKKVRDYAAWLRNLAASPGAGGRAPAGGDPAPMLVVLRRNADGRSIDLPIPTLAASGQHVGLAEPFLLKQHFRRDLQSADDPAPSVTTISRIGLVEPFVISQASGGAPRSTEEPLPTAPTGGAHALIAPYYGSGSGETCTTSDDPLPTLTTLARFAMVVPITHSDGSGRARDVDVDPLPTLTTANRGQLAFVTAQFGEREGQAPRVHSVDEPTPAVTATGHVNLVEALDDVDCLYRMLLTDELAAAQGFNRDGALYDFAGNKTEQIRQIGNAVPVELVEAEIKAFVADDFGDPAGFLEAAE